MIINRIQWLSESAKEAIVFVGDGTYECVAFSQPCTFEEGYCLRDPLLALAAKGIMKTDSFIEQINCNFENFSCEIVGKLSNVKSRIVTVGSIVIELSDSLPGGLEQGDMLEFTCSRLDVIR